MIRLAALLVALAAAAFSQSADTVLINGKILTVDSQSSVREAIAIRGGRILAVGSTADIPSWPVRPRVLSICRTARSSPA